MLDHAYLELDLTLDAWLSIVEIGSFTENQKEDVLLFIVGVVSNRKCLIVPSRCWIANGKTERRSMIIPTRSWILWIMIDRL